MPPEVRGVAAQGSPAALRIEPVGKPPPGSATCPFLRSLLEIAADTPAMESLPLPGHGAGPAGQHRRGEEIDDQAAEGPVFRTFQTAVQDVHQFIALHRDYSPLRRSHVQSIPAPGLSTRAAPPMLRPLPVRKSRSGQCRRGGHGSLSNALRTVGALTCRSLPMRL